MLAVDGLTFENTRGYKRSNPLIQMSDDNPTGKAVSHFRNVKVLRRDAKDPRPVVNTGGDAHVTPKTPHKSPCILRKQYCTLTWRTGRTKVRACARPRPIPRSKATFAPRAASPRALRN